MSRVEKKQEEEHPNINSIPHYLTYKKKIFNIFYTESRIKSTLIRTDEEPARTGSVTFPETTWWIVEVNIFTFPNITAPSIGLVPPLQQPGNQDA